MKRITTVSMILLLLIGTLGLYSGIEPARSEPKTWTVDDDGPADFDTIQEAINAASDGDTIEVAPGIYYENIDLNKCLSLVGENRENTIIDANRTGKVVVVGANKVIIEQFTIRNSGEELEGVYIDSYNDTTIRNNNVINNGWCGIKLLYSYNNTIHGNSMTKNGWCGIDLWSSSYNSLCTNNATTNTYCGIGFSGSSNNNMIYRNNVTNQSPFGIAFFYSSDNNTIYGNSVVNNEYGIGISGSYNNTVCRNSVVNNEYGIGLRWSINNTIYHNNFMNNTDQVESNYSADIWDNGYLFGGNYWSDYYETDLNKDGIGDDPYVVDEENMDWYPIMSTLDIRFPVHNLGSGLGYSTIQQAIDAAETENRHIITVDEATYYEHVAVTKSLTLAGEDRSATVINGNGTWVAVALGTNVTFTGFTVENADVGVNLGGYNIYVSGIDVDNCHLGIWARECLQCVISGNNVNNQTVKKGTWEDFGGCGIALDGCIYCNVTENNANNDELIGIWVRGGLNNIIGNNANNNGIGLVLDDARNCTVAENNLSSNICGIELEPAYNSSIYANDISNNAYGLSLTGSQSNLIYHNNFINNTEYVEIGLGYYNVWDDGCEGNYWSDYNGTDYDEYGIGYDPYVIDENNTDHYPLMNPYISGDVNHDAKVNIVDISIIAKAFGSSPEDATWDPHADLDENDEINILDIAMAAKEFGKEWVL